MRQHSLTRFVVRVAGTVAMVTALYGLTMAVSTGGPWYIGQAVVAGLAANLAVLYIKAPRIAARRDRIHAAQQRDVLAEATVWEQQALPQLIAELADWEQHLDTESQKHTRNEETNGSEHQQCEGH